MMSVTDIATELEMDKWIKFKSPKLNYVYAGPLGGRRTNLYQIDHLVTGNLHTQQTMRSCFGAVDECKTSISSSTLWSVI